QQPFLPSPVQPSVRPLHSLASVSSETARMAPVSALSSEQQEVLTTFSPSEQQESLAASSSEQQAVFSSQVIEQSAPMRGQTSSVLATGVTVLLSGEAFRAL